MIIQSEKSFWVFDLDDTLYKEADFLRSGLLSVAARINELYGKDISADIIEWQNKGEKDIFLKVCQTLNLSNNVKEALLWHYRLHKPDISLSEETKEILHWLQEHSQGVAILTDGRSITQRAKLLQLGLDYIPAYISEEYSSEKPELLRFEYIMNAHPAKNYVYVGDNPKKDFFAPKKLGWQTVGLKGDERNIHSQELSGLAKVYLPDLWVETISKLKSYIC